MSGQKTQVTINSFQRLSLLLGQQELGWSHTAPRRSNESRTTPESPKITPTNNKKSNKKPSPERWGIKKTSPRWWFHFFLIFTPTWGNDPIWRAYFPDGLVQPPTSHFFHLFFFLHPLDPLASQGSRPSVARWSIWWPIKADLPWMITMLGLKSGRYHGMNINIPGTQMTLVLMGKDLVLGGWPSKIEVSWVLGIYIYTRWWQLKHFLFSPRNLGKMNPIWRAYFSDGLKPPTSIYIYIYIIYLYIYIYIFGPKMWDLDDVFLQGGCRGVLHRV